MSKVTFYDKRFTDTAGDMGIQKRHTGLLQSGNKVRKKMSGLDKYLVFSFSVLLIYTVASMVIFIITGLEMSTLTMCIYAAFGGEVLACAMIKRLKLKKDDKEAG